VWKRGEIVFERITSEGSGNRDPVVAPAAVNVVPETSDHALEQQFVPREHDVRAAIEDPAADRSRARMATSLVALFEKHKLEIGEKRKGQAARAGAEYSQF